MVVWMHAAEEDAHHRGSSSGAAKRMRTTSQNDADAVVLAERRKLAHEAARWAVDNGKGSKAARTRFCDDPMKLTYNMMQPLLTQLKTTGKIADEDRDHHNQILTNTERRKLADWILACADGQSPKNRVQISAKIRVMLRARHASNKKRKWGVGTIRLSAPEVAAAKSKAPQLTHTFFQRFYPWCRAHGIKIDEGVERPQDEKRTAKMTEPTVDRHFHGVFGLEAELIDAQIMDPHTKVMQTPGEC